MKLSKETRKLLMGQEDKKKAKLSPREVEELKKEDKFEKLRKEINPRS